MLMGVCTLHEPRDSSLMPSLARPISPDWTISLGVICFVASIRPASIQCCRRSRLTSARSSLRLDGNGECQYGLFPASLSTSLTLFSSFFYIAMFGPVRFTHWFTNPIWPCLKINGV
jgi:hypothetical protein